MADNSYNVEIKPSSSAGYHTPDGARRYYGKYDRSGVTYHWWNRPDRIADNEHDSIVNYMNGNAAKGAAPTVNYVASGSKLTLCINPDNVAWTSSNGNPTTIGVECSPHFTESFYKKLGWLHDQLEQRYNRTLAIFVHFDWTPTECSPIVKQKIRDYANFWKAERNAPAPAPVQQPPAPPTVTLKIADIVNKKVKVHRTANLWDLAFKKYSEAKTINPVDFPNGFPVGHIIEVSATAEHPLGSKYYLTDYSYSRGVGAGINVKDVDDFIDVVAPPNPAPVIQPPKDAPTIPAPVITPKPTPVPIPLPTKDQEQDKRLDMIEKFINALKRLLRRK